MSNKVIEGVFFLTGKDFSNAGAASSNLKGILEGMSVQPDIIRRAAIAAFEAEMNVIIYAVAGMMHYYITPETIRIVVKDMGSEIPDIGLAMTEGFSTAPDYIRELGFGSGMGLPNIKKNTDKLDLDSVVGGGTTLEFIIYLNKDAKGAKMQKEQKMKLYEIVNSLSLEVKTPSLDLNKEVTGGYVSDLLSDVIGNSKKGNVWITLQTHQNIIAVAALRDMSGIILVNGRNPDADTLLKADEQGIPLMVSSLPAFELVGRLYSLGIRCQ